MRGLWVLTLIAGAVWLAAVLLYSLLYYRGLGLVNVVSLLVSAALTYLMMTLLSNGIGLRRDGTFTGMRVRVVGDVTGRSQLTPIAVREGWYVAETLFNNNPQWVDHSQIGTAVRMRALRA